MFAPTLLITLLGLSGISPNDKLSPAIGLRFSSVVSQMPRIHKGMSQREVYRIMNLEDAVPSSIGGSIHGRYTTFCIPPMFELSLTFKHELDTDATVLESARIQLDHKMAMTRSHKR